MLKRNSKIIIGVLFLLVIILVLAVKFNSVVFWMSDFGYLMNPLYKEISLEEIEDYTGSRGLKVYKPSYLPDGLKISKAEVIERPRNSQLIIVLSVSKLSDINSTGSKEISIREYLILDKNDSEIKIPTATTREIQINNTIIQLVTFENSDYLHISFVVNSTKIQIIRLNSSLPETELIKIAESMIPEGL